LRNVFLKRIRGAGREIPEGDAPTWESAPKSATSSAPVSGNPEEEFFQTVLHGDVDRALRALPLPFREAVILSDLEGLSYKEVAEVLSCPTGTVMSRLWRGRHLLRQALSEFARARRYVKDKE